VIQETASPAIVFIFSKETKKYRDSPLTIQKEQRKTKIKHTLAIAIASSKPGGGVSSSSPNFNSPNFVNKKMKNRSREVGYQA